MPKLIWYQLSDESGNMIPKTWPDCIAAESLSPPNVAMLRKSIKSSNSILLQNVEAVNLAVFTSQTAFIEGSTPLASSFNVIDLETDDGKNVLWVVINQIYGLNMIIDDVQMNNSKRETVLQWSIEELQLDAVCETMNLILQDVAIPVLSYVEMKSQVVPLNPKKPDSIIMLLHGLDCFPVESLRERFNDHQVWSMVATSGMGKTHTAFSYLAKNFGVYLSCTEPSAINFGSSDMSYFIQRLGIDGRFNDSYNHNYLYVQRFIRCIVLARLFVFNYFRTKRKLCPTDWLLLQLFPLRILHNGLHNDIFWHMVVLIRSLNPLELNEMYTRELLKFPGSCPIFLDEAQILCGLYEGCFHFSKERPLYSAVCKSLIANGDSKVSVCAIGTGLTLSTIADLNASDSYKHAVSSSTTIVINFRFGTPKDVFAYLEQFIEKTDDLVHICKWLTGRPSVAALFLQKVYEEGMSANLCEQFIKTLTTGDGPNSMFNNIELLASGKRSIKDVSRITNLMVTLRAAVMTYLYTSDFMYCDNVDSFELGFGILIRASPQIILCEPIVLMAAFNFFFGNNFCDIKSGPIQLMSFFATNPSCLGYLFEMTIPHLTGKLLSLDEDARKSIFGEKLWRYEALQIFKRPSAFFVPYIRKESEENSLRNHLERPVCELLSLDIHRGADFAASVSHQGKKIGEISIQVKFRKQFNQREAMEKTVWKPFEYDPHILQIRVLVAYPKRTKFKLCKVEKNRVTLIVDSRNATSFFTAYDIRFFDQLKSNDALSHLENFDSICNEIGLEEE